MLTKASGFSAIRVPHDVHVRRVNRRLKKLLADSELQGGSDIRKFRIPLGDGNESDALHFRPPAVIADELGTVAISSRQ